MSNPLNELSKVYKKQIASESVALPPETIAKVGQYTRQIRYHARKEDIPIPKAFNDIASKSNMSGTERGAVRKKLGLAESGMPNVDPKDKAAINKRSKGLFKKDLTGDVQGVNETSLSNWRYELREMEEEVPSMKKISDQDGEIKEKKIKNKVIINPPMGNMESVIKDMGGTLLEVKEIVEGECDCKGCEKNPCGKCGGNCHDIKENVAGIALSPQELNTQKRMAMLNVKLAKERKNSINRIKKSEVEEGYDTKKREEVIKALKKKKGDFKKRYGKDAEDVMYAVAAKTAKEKGDTSKSDDKYAYEEVVLEGDRPKNAYPANLRAKTMMMNKKDRQKHFDAYDKSNPVKKVTKEEYVDKALSNVIGNIRKSGGVMASDLPKATDKQKAEWKAEKARRAAQKKSTGNPYKPRQGESD